MNFSVHIIHFTIGLTFLMSAGLLVHSLRFRNVVLAFFLAGLGYLNLFVYLYHTGQIFDYPNYFMILLPIEISLGPLLYLYVLTFIKNKQKFYYQDILHFVPLFLCLVFLIPYSFAPNEMKKELVRALLLQGEFKFFQIVTSSIASVLLPITYISLSIWQIWFRKPSENPAYQILLFLISMLIIWVFMGFVGIVGAVSGSSKLLEFANVITSIVIICFYIIAQKYPYLIQYGTIPNKKKPYAKSHLNNIDIKNINRQLKIIMEDEKLFCDEDLSLGRLSDAIGITKHQLSEFLNEYHKQNFNNYVNSFRINEAKKILVEEPKRQILSIALAVGFNSYSAFHSTFKKLIGISPAEFRRRNEA